MTPSYTTAQCSQQTIGPLYNSRLPLRTSRDQEVVAYCDVVDAKNRNKIRGRDADKEYTAFTAAAKLQDLQLKLCDAMYKVNTLRSY